jgi:hypothetical protein
MGIEQDGNRALSAIAKIGSLEPPDPIRISAVLIGMSLIRETYGRESLP